MQLTWMISSGNPPEWPLRALRTSKRWRRKKFLSVVVTHIVPWQVKSWNSTRHHEVRRNTRSTVCSICSNRWEGSTKISGRTTCLVARLPLVNIYFDGAICIAHRRFADTRSVFPAFGIVWYVFNHIGLSHDVELTILTQPWLSQASRTHPLRHAAMLVTATPFGESSLCVSLFAQFATQSHLQVVHHFHPCRAPGVLRPNVRKDDCVQEESEFDGEVPRSFLIESPTMPCNPLLRKGRSCTTPLTPPCPSIPHGYLCPHIFRSVSHISPLCAICLNDVSRDHISYSVVNMYMNQFPNESWQSF